MEHDLWNMPARVVLSLDRPVFRGSLAMCVVHFRDRMSPIWQVTSHIALEKGMLDGKVWLGPEDIHALLGQADLPCGMQAAY